VLPVLDLLNGEVVHAVAGERSKYGPVRSRLTRSSRPLDVARALRDRLELDQFYLADLDALQHGRSPDFEVFSQLTDDGFRLLVDAGARKAEDARALLESGVAAVIVALETLESPDDVTAVLEEIGADCTVFSLDLQGGRPLGGPTEWRGLAPLEIARRVLELFVTRLLVLDLSAVGTSSGWPLHGLVEGILSQNPAVEITSGGGIRSLADLEALRVSGVSAALVATALHSEAIGREELSVLDQHVAEP